MSSNSEKKNKVLLRRSYAVKQQEPKKKNILQDTINNNKRQLGQELSENLSKQPNSNSPQNMASTTYQTADDDHHEHHAESTRFGPITETLISTLSHDSYLFMICLVFVEVLGIVLVILVTCWMLQIGGLGFDKTIIFNFHPVLMTLGMIFLNANGINNNDFLNKLTNVHLFFSIHHL